MNVMIIATKTCHHCPLLERQLQGLGVAYTVQFVEDHPELMEKYGICTSPTIVVDDKVIWCRTCEEQLPPRPQLKEWFHIK